jgi:hypothetical protein
LKKEPMGELPSPYRREIEFMLYGDYETVRQLLYLAQQSE